MGKRLVTALGGFLTVESRLEGLDLHSQPAAENGYREFDGIIYFIRSGASQSASIAGFCV